MRKYRFHLWLTLLGIMAFAGRIDASDWIKFKPAGDFVINNGGNDIHGLVYHYAKGWKLKAQHHRTISVKSRQGNNITGVFATATKGDFQFEQKVDFLTPNEIAYHASMKNAKGVDTSQLCLALMFPTGKFSGKSITIDDKKVVFPKKYDKLIFHPRSQTKRIELPITNGYLVIEGDLKVMIQDNRAFKGGDYAMRIDFTQASGLVTDSSLDIKIKFRYIDATAISIAKVANMGFRDDIADDGKGGWTDQGKNNDLRMIKPGLRRMGGIPFDIVDPAKNSGKSCLAMAGPNRDYFTKTTSIDVKQDTYKYIYILHAAAWARTDDAYGKVRVIHTDGSESKFDVVGKRDVADWWSACSIENGKVVWTGENASTFVGLFMSRFPVAEKPISKIEISSTEKAVWMIAGLAGCKEDVPLPTDSGEYYIVKGKDWEPFTHSLDVEEGSAMDMSFLADAPAGKYGHVVATKDGHFNFEKKPGERVRFYGCNLCFTANYLDKENCEKLAERLVRYGYNSVRFHHHDNGLVKKDAPDSLTIDPEQMDKLDYLFYCLKQKGIYITTDIFISRYLKKSEVKELREDPELRGRDVKELVPVSPEVLGNMHAFAKKWLGHVNPYTKIAWKDDPALFGISFTNENTLYATWSRKPLYKKIYLELFEEWLKHENISVETQAEKDKALTQFITNLQIKSYEDMKTYVKGVLKCKALYSDCNMSDYMCQTLARDKFDYVDNHGYWDHPKFPVKNWSLPYGFHNMSVIKRYATVPCRQMATRVFGKPFTFTEFNYVFPNKYRAEGNAVMGALASLQDWDGIYRFAYAHRDTYATKVQAARGFDVASDPLTLMGERIVAMLYLRGDVKVAKSAVPYVLSPECTRVAGGNSGSGRTFPPDFAHIGLVHRIGSLVVRDGANLPQGTKFAVALEDINSPLLKSAKIIKDEGDITGAAMNAGELGNGHFNPESRTTLSDTGEVALDATANTFKVVTPKSECVVMPAGKDMACDSLTVEGNTTYASVFAGSLDGKALAESQRILILHLTDIKNTKTKYLDPNGRRLAKNGVLPHLVKKGVAKISLKTGNKALPTVWALDVTGKRLGKMEVSKADGGFGILADTIGTYGSVMAYEATWE